jgi:endonuclease/exonuclease/phosphatase family metal-dependent hydrolase
VPPRLRVATYNLHAGVDGWGRVSAVVDTAVALDADVLFCQESWRGEGVDLAEDIARRSGAVARSWRLGEGARATGGEGPARWQHRAGLFLGNRGLALDGERPMPSGSAARLAAAGRIERGEWCIAIVSRLPVLDEVVVELPQLARDLARRVVAITTLETATGPLKAVVVHGAHLSHGSLVQYRALVAALDAHVGAGPAVLGGDLNCWGPVARRVLRGWRQAARGATWPSWRPHSQVDHLFVRGDVAPLGGAPVDARASDHRPVLATIEVRPAAGP